MDTRLRLGTIVGLLLAAGGLMWLLLPGNSRKEPKTGDALVSTAVPEKNQTINDHRTTARNIATGSRPIESSASLDSARNDPFISFISLLSQGTGQDMKGLVSLYEKLDEGPEKYAAFFSLLKYWARSDPDGAMQYALPVKIKERDKKKLYQDIYGEVASRYPEEFVSGILNEANPDMRASKTVAAIQLLGRSDPVRIIAAIEAEERTSGRDDLLKLWLKEVTESHPESALDYVTGFNDAETRQKAAASAMIEVSRSDPELAGLHYSRLLHDTETKASVLPSIIKGYYRNAVGNTVPVEQWIQNNLLTTEEYDVAAATMVELMVAENVDVALQWLDSIENENLYNATVQEIEKKYSKKTKSPEPKP